MRILILTLAFVLVGCGENIFDPSHDAQFTLDNCMTANENLISTNEKLIKANMQLIKLNKEFLCDGNLLIDMLNKNPDMSIRSYAKNLLRECRPELSESIGDFQLRQGYFWPEGYSPISNTSS